MMVAPIGHDGGVHRSSKVVSYEVYGYNHNMADGFLSLRPAIYASGALTFSGAKYRARV